jgi:hypothetical protein
LLFFFWVWLACEECLKDLASLVGQTTKPNMLLNIVWLIFQVKLFSRSDWSGWSGWFGCQSDLADFDDLTGLSVLAGKCFQMLPNIIITK